MAVMQICEVCGNGFDAALAGPGRCPYCHSRQSNSSYGVVPNPSSLYRQINLEKGMPVVEQAVKRLETEIRVSRLQGIRVLSLIHGYGSSGRGGAIREAVRARLTFLEQQQRVESVIPGEEFEGRSNRGKQLLRRYPFLRRHHDLNRANPGVTLVLLPHKPVKDSH